MKVTDLQVLQACADPTSFGIIDKLTAATGECEKVCFRALERVCGKGLIDCGVSLNSAWLTDAGTAVLNAARGAESEPHAGDRAG